MDNCVYIFQGIYPVSVSIDGFNTCRLHPLREKRLLSGTNSAVNAEVLTHQTVAKGCAYKTIGTCYQNIGHIQV
jgi:hypothetical protein